MKVLIKQFLGTNHSWGVVGQNFARQFIKLNHQVDLFSTNGIQYFPPDLKSNLIGHLDENERKIYGKEPDQQYDLALSYTCLKNSHYLQNGRNRFLIWVYEWPIISPGFSKHHHNLNYILAPSNFSRDIFIANKIPETKVKTIPHGMDLAQFENKNKYQLKTKKTTKILVNLGQSHRRKNIDGIFRAYYEAFSKDDDVCLVAKMHQKEITAPFDVDVLSIYKYYTKQYKNPAEVELILDYVPNIVELYNACDIVYSMAHCEGFYLPGLESIGAGKINLCPKFGGQLDFLSENNALLIDGKMARAPLDHQYWQGDIRNQHFVPDIDDAVQKLRYAVSHKEELTKKFNENSKDILKQYTWENAAKQIIDLCV